MRYFFLLTFLLSCYFIHAQSISPGSCGLLYSYDAAGNRIKQEYFCNNTSTVVVLKATPVEGINSVIKPDSTAKAETNFIAVDALYPNPTTGRFTIRFAKQLKDIRVIIADQTGKVVQQVTGNGYTMDFDLSGKAAGTYFIMLYNGKSRVTYKVVKL